MIPTAPTNEKVASSAVAMATSAGARRRPVCLVDILDLYRAAPCEA
jgi:hypothetical protein